MNANQQVRIDIVHVEGRTIEGVKLIGLLPDAAYAQGEDFNIYIQWDTTYGAVRATRSDTDEQIITVGLTGRKAKGAAFAELMQALADHYGLTVTVQADPGIKGAHALKLCGTWAPNLACEPFNPTDPSTWNEANLPAGWAWVESAEGDGEFRLFTPEGVDHTQAMSDLRDAQAAQRRKDAHDTLSGLVGQVLVFDGAVERIVTRVEDNLVWLVTVGQDVPKHYPMVGVYEHITQGRIVVLDACDIAEGNAQAWAEAGSPRDAAGQPKLFTDHDMRDQVTAYLNAAGLVVVPAWVSMIVESLQEAHGTISIDDIDPEAFAQVIDFHMSTIEETRPVTSGLPNRTPGRALAQAVSVPLSDETWAAMEAVIWAGTDQVERMRYPRKLKKAMRKDQFGWQRPNRLAAKRARIAQGR